jgi:hypothetical protein
MVWWIILTSFRVPDPNCLAVGVDDDFKFLFVNVSVFALLGEKLNLPS